jgi:hypothetical protein
MDSIRPIVRREPEVRPVQGAEHRRIKRDDRDEPERRRRERQAREQRERAAAEQQPPPPEEGEGGLVDVRV